MVNKGNVTVLTTLTEGEFEEDLSAVVLATD